MRRGGSENLRPGARLFDAVRKATGGEVDDETSLAGRDGSSTDSEDRAPPPSGPSDSLFAAAS